jgi:hypothetical protein
MPNLRITPNVEQIDFISARTSTWYLGERARAVVDVLAGGQDDQVSSINV